MVDNREWLQCASLMSNTNGLCYLSRVGCHCVLWTRVLPSQITVDTNISMPMRLATDTTIRSLGGHPFKHEPRSSLFSFGNPLRPFSSLRFVVHVLIVWSRAYLPDHLCLIHRQWSTFSLYIRIRTALRLVAWLSVDVILLEVVIMAIKSFWFFSQSVFRRRQRFFSM